MIYFIILLGFELCSMAVSSLTYSSMTCNEDSAYRNNWDGTHLIHSSWFLNGQYSYHSNSNKDRRFKWRCCRPVSDSSPQGAIIMLPRTWYDATWERGCGGNTGLMYAWSWHNNGNEDRKWDFRCAELDSKFIVTSCSWTAYLNSFDGILDYDCPNNGIIRTIRSYHNNGKEDRRFKFECCRTADNEYTYPAMSCIWDATYRNDWDGSHNNIQHSRFLSGQMSVHTNDKEDRRFKWRYCKPSALQLLPAFTDTQPLSKTEYDAQWTRTCADYNDGHAAMIGGSSYHSNLKEDRRWTWKCGLLNTRLYSLVNCGWTGYLNNYDSSLDFSCPNDGVIRSIWSDHSSGREDRIWKFECCQIAQYTHLDPVGFWYPILSVPGGDPFVYKISVGISQTETNEITEAYSSSLSYTVSQGFKFAYKTLSVSTSVSITGTTAQTTTNKISSSFTQFKTIEQTIQCSKNNLFQWRTSVTETLPEIGSRKIDIDAGFYLCTDNDEPQCPVGWCDFTINEDCTQCKDGYPYKYPILKKLPLWQPRLIETYS